MSTPNPYAGVKKTVAVQSDVFGPCAECGKPTRSSGQGLTESINHYLDHGYKLLHVGTETFYDQAPQIENDLQHYTVAILGK
jgi:hypothetical protein